MENDSLVIFFIIIINTVNFSIENNGVNYDNLENYYGNIPAQFQAICHNSINSIFQTKHCVIFFLFLVQTKILI